MIPDWLKVSGEVAAALAARQPVVALESTLIAHGLPWPVNLETALESEAAVRAAGAIPATIAIWHGTPTVGLNREQLEELARTKQAVKAGRRDLGVVVAQKRLAATTVSATMALASAAGIAVFATGGIGGVHPGDSLDISADLMELARTPVLVVCAGAKNILDLPRTMEYLETQGVPVLGYRTDTFPAFYVARSELPVSGRVESPAEAAAAFAAHTRMGGGGMVLAQPCPESVALDPDEFQALWQAAEQAAAEQAVRGAALTPFLLAHLARESAGRTLTANRALIVANSRLAAEAASALANP